MSDIFISYRRQDSSGYVGRLNSDLKQVFEDRVFLDVADVAPGEDFTGAMRRAVSSSKAMLVVIGPEWVTATDPRGERRIDDPADFIRSEIAAALSEGKPVVPVLVGGAQMPGADQLPADLHDLAKRQALQLRDQSWDEDVERLVRALNQLTGPPLPSPPSGVRPAPPIVAPRPRAIGFWTRLIQAFYVLIGRVKYDEALTKTSPSPRSSERGTREKIASVAQPPPRRHEVFVSYSTKDIRFAENMVRALEGRGRICWIAPRDIPAGVPSWAEPIVTAIANSRLMVVLLTENSIPSIDVIREVTLAADEKIPLLGVTLDAAPLSPGLRYYFVAGQRLDVARLGPEDQVRNILPVVEKQLPAMH